MKQEEVNKIKKQNISQYYLFIGLLVLVLFGALIFSYMQLQKATTKISDQLALLNQYSLEEFKIEKLMDDYKAVEGQSELLTQAIPDKNNLVNFIEDIEKIGDILGLDLSVNMKEGVIDEGGVVVDVESEATERVTTYSGINDVEVLEVGITTRTDPNEFSKIINFIGMLDDLKYYSKIVDMKFISGIEELNGEAYLDSVLTLNLYVKSGEDSN